jgi:hypothetical protein
MRIFKQSVLKRVNSTNRTKILRYLTYDLRILVNFTTENHRTIAMTFHRFSYDNQEEVVKRMYPSKVKL